jgi:hypothetical protein
MRILLVALTIATWYTGPAGAPLFCGGVYADTTAPWVALPVETWGEEWQCGDLIYISFGQGDALMVRAMDAGPFGNRCVLQVDGTCAPIVVDVPRHLWPRSMEGWSAGVQVVNVTAQVRESRVQ